MHLITLIILFYAINSWGQIDCLDQIDYSQFLHSHNDYIKQEKPLLDALENDIYSVEADIWLMHNQLQLSHLGLFFRGTLQDLYLDPLQQMVNSRIFRKQQFLLWIEFKQSSEYAADVLYAELKKYPMVLKNGPVKIILTGKENVKKYFINKYHDLNVTRDSHQFGAKNNDQNFEWYALKWSKYIKWNGKTEMPFDQRIKLKQMVKAIHQEGRKIRFFAAPENFNVLKEACEAGVDLMGVHNLSYDLF